MTITKELWTPGVEIPKGHVTVELFDERGKKKAHEEGDNFISTYLQDCMKQLQRQWWGYNFYGVKNTDTYGRTILQLPPMPMNHIMAWNDATAEDTAETYRRGYDTIAFASRYLQGSPTGKRGVLNSTESTSTPTSITWVWDWLTTNGNGTFQSVGWGNANDSGDPLGVMPDAFYGTAAPVQVSCTGSNSYMGGIWHDGTGFCVLYSSGTVNGTSNWEIWRIDDTTGVGTAQVQPISTTRFKHGSAFNTTPIPKDICKIGSDWYIIGPTTSGTKTCVLKINSSGTEQWYVDHDGGGSEMPAGATGYGYCITSDGTDLYVGYGSATAASGRVYRLSASTGLVTATITPAKSTQGIVGIAWDGTNLVCISAEGFMWTMDTSGNTITTDPLVSFGSGSGVGGNDTGTATSPGSGSFITPSVYLSQQFVMAPYHSLTNGANNDWDQSPTTNFATIDRPYLSGAGAVGAIAIKSSKVYGMWFSSFVTSQSTTKPHVHQVTGTSLGSRVRLGSAVTKTSAQTMKITYTLTFS